MVWIVALIGIGFLLILAEIFFVPGTTVVGGTGIILTGFGIYMVYQQHSVSAGHLTLSLAIVVFIIALIGGFRSRAWEQYSNQDYLTGKTNVIQEDQIKPGDTGKAISAIKPIGKARINDDNFEVQAFSDFIDAGETIKVTKKAGKTVYVVRNEDTNPSKSG